MHNFEIEKIHDTVWVFKNAIKSPQDFVDHFEKTRKWEDWYTFGKVAYGANFSTVFDNFPTPEDWESAKETRTSELKDDYYFEEQINSLFHESSKLYVEANSVSMDNWNYQGWNVAKYEPKQTEDKAMDYHTDYQREYTHNPGAKFVVTAVFYLNDNYVGGDVIFKFLDKDDLHVLKEEYTYRPSAGDIVMFLSGHPHYHGVRNVSEGEKYIIRTYWRYQDPGHPLWISLQEKYGEETWEEMEKVRVRATRSSENITKINEIPFWDTFEEYYKDEIGKL